jgi:hypothetical protein
MQAGHPVLQKVRWGTTKLNTSLFSENSRYCGEETSLPSVCFFTQTKREGYIVLFDCEVTKYFVLLNGRAS